MIRKATQSLPKLQPRFFTKDLHYTIPSQMPCAGGPSGHDPYFDYAKSRVRSALNELDNIQNLQHKKNEAATQKLASCRNLVSLLFNQVDSKKLDKDKVNKIEELIMMKR